MSKKFILNKTNSVLTLHDNKLNTIVKLQPKQCSFQSFEEYELLQSPYVYKTYSNGYIALLNERVDIIKKNTAKNYGQKYKIGTRAYLGDKNNLDIIIEDYNPNTLLYTVKLVRTGGRLKTEEKSISLTKHKGDAINIDINEDGELYEVNKATDLSLPQEPEEVQIVRTEDREYNKPVNAKSLLSNQDNLANEIANQKVDIVYKDDKKEQPSEEETFIVKTENGFAKEISSSEMMDNTQKAINKAFQEVIDSTKIVAEENKQKEVGVKEENFIKLSTELQEFISNFMNKDNRSKKLIISRLKDVEKLTAIMDCADELSSKAAKVKLDKLNV